MSAPRPSEADVESLAVEEWHVPFCGSGLVESDFERRRCVDLDDLRVLLAARDAEHEREVAEAEVRGQMRHITAEVARGDQSLGAKEDLIADLRARLSHVGAERDSWRARAATNRDGWRQMLARAEAAERALADLRGEIEALLGNYKVRAMHWPEPRAQWADVVADLCALLRRDDAANYERDET